MIPRFDFLRPRSLDAALKVLSENADGVTVIAGGTDVIPGMQQGDPRFCTARSVVDIHHLSELRAVVENGSLCHLGAALTFSELVAHARIRSEFPLLSQAAASIGSVQIRNRATLGGNFINNAACADSVPPLLVYDARVRIRSLKGEREMPLGDFLLAPNLTALARDELVTEVLLPPVPPGYVGRFYKLGRRRGIAVARLTLAVLLKVNASVVEDVRIASGAATPIGVRFPELESEVRGKMVSEDLWAALAQELGKAVLERTGLRWSAAYKLPVLQQALFGMLCDLSFRRQA
jgi:xanthine dehydrogenase FAD-binding subunit